MTEIPGGTEHSSTPIVTPVERLNNEYQAAMLLYAAADSVLLGFRGRRGPTKRLAAAKLLLESTRGRYAEVIQPQSPEYHI